MSSGLFVGGVSSAVAVAEPNSSGDAAGTGTAGRNSTESSGHPRRSAPRSVGTVTRAGSGWPGRQSTVSPAGTADSAVPPADAGESDPSKLPGAGTEVGEARPGSAPGEQDAGPSAVDADGSGDVKQGDVEEGEEDDDECGWWPLPPDTGSSAPNGGDGYDGGAPPAAELPGGPPETPESPVLPTVPDAAEPLTGPIAPAAMPVLSMPVAVLPPVLPGIGGGGVGAGPRTNGQEDAALPPAPSRTPPAEPPAAPRTDAVLPASYRAGYGEYLRTAGMPEVIAVAVPGATAIMLLTGAGGLIGYRQARAGVAIRAGGSARFSS
jgi:hypothetical protein